MVQILVAPRWPGPSEACTRRAAKRSGPCHVPLGFLRNLPHLAFLSVVLVCSISRMPLPILTCVCGLFRQLIRDGVLRCVPIGNKSFIDRLDLDKFIEKTKVGVAARVGSGNGIRTRVSTLRGWRPKPLVDTARRLSYRASDFSAIGVALAGLNWPTLMRASFTSSVVLMLHRSKIAAVLCPVIFIAVLQP